MVINLSEGKFSIDEKGNILSLPGNGLDASIRTGDLIVPIQPFLISNKGENILLDCGLGNEESGRPTILNNLSNHGFTDRSISKLLISHLHEDHCGGMVKSIDDNFQPTFPNATYYINKQEWDLTIQKNKKALFNTKMEALFRSEQIVFLEKNTKIGQGIFHFESGGHTPNHEVFLIESEGQSYFYGADVIPTAGQLLRKFRAKYDFDGKQSMEKRAEYKQIGLEQGWVFLFYHGDVPCAAKIRVEAGRVLLEKVALG